MMSERDDGAHSRNNRRVVNLTALSLVVGILALGIAATVLVMHRTDRNREITVVTFNLRDSRHDEGHLAWSNRRAAVRELIATLSPDILAVQEATERQQEDIASGDLRGRVPVDEEWGEAGNLNAILFDDRRFSVERSGVLWLSDTPAVARSTSWGNEIPRWSTWAHVRRRRTLLRPFDSSSVAIYNVHLDHQSPESRLRSVELILDHAAEHAPELPVVLLGDFNAREDWPEIRLLRESGAGVPHRPYADAVGVSTDTGDEEGTYHRFGEQEDPDRVDYIFTSRDIEVQSAEVVRDRSDEEPPASDHYPVVAILTIS
jgi:endonuclease/exonuclease/phosphatase family metal-dependent hydrolase